VTALHRKICGKLGLQRRDFEEGVFSGAVEVEVRTAFLLVGGFAEDLPDLLKSVFIMFQHPFILLLKDP